MDEALALENRLSSYRRRGDRTYPLCHSRACNRGNRGQNGDIKFHRFAGSVVWRRLRHDIVTELKRIELVHAAKATLRELEPPQEDEIQVCLHMIERHLDRRGGRGSDQSSCAAFGVGKSWVSLEHEKHSSIVCIGLLLLFESLLGTRNRFQCQRGPPHDPPFGRRSDGVARSTGRADGSPLPAAWLTPASKIGDAARNRCGSTLRRRPQTCEPRQLLQPRRSP